MFLFETKSKFSSHSPVGGCCVKLNHLIYANYYSLCTQNFLWMKQGGKTFHFPYSNEFSNVAQSGLEFECLRHETTEFSFSFNIGELFEECIFFFLLIFVVLFLPLGAFQTRACLRTKGAFCLWPPLRKILTFEEKRVN